MDILLNEKSLHGQFESTEAFLETLPCLLRCIEVVKGRKDIRILKISDFYQCCITENDRLQDLKCYHGDDRLRKLKLELDKQIYNHPFWDYEPAHDYEI